MYAVGQGALAVECRVNDPFILNILHKLCDLETQCRIITERSFLKTLGGGCSAPVAVCTNLKKNSLIEGNNYTLDVDGAVWSLDGKTEIVDKILFHLSLDIPTKDETENAKSDVITTKRVKLNEYRDESLKKIPVVLNENVLPCSSLKTMNEKLNITEIMNIHGKVFNQCPFTGKFNKKSEHQHFIGQDFMGDCPVLNTNQKISHDSANVGAGDESSEYLNENVKKKSVFLNENVLPCSSSKMMNEKLNITEIMNIHGKVFNQCPFTGKFNEKSEHQDFIGQDFMGDCPVLNTHQKVSYDSSSVGAGDEAFSCPVISKLSTHPNVSTEQIAKCPFFTDVELIDYEANNKGNLKRKSLVEDCMSNDDSVNLFCGLYCHKKHLKQVFQMCENMGINLANKLISAGALAVMKIAQSEIHSK